MPANPPAFPFHHNWIDNNGFDGPVTRSESNDGMTLRDWFAGQALIGLASEHHGNDWELYT